jgi:membrane protein DedA with SNARE-associated domain
VSSHEIHHLLDLYGLLIVFAAAAIQALGPPVPGTTVLIAAALYAGTAHGLPIEGVIVAGAVGALAGTSAAYAIGRYAGERLLTAIARRLGRSRTHVDTVRQEFADHGGAWVFIGRFITGLRNAVGLLAGSSGMSVRRFLPVCAAACTLWATVNALEYYFFGHALAGAGTWLQVTLVCVGIGWTALTFGLIRRRAVRRLRGLSERTGESCDPVGDRAL